MPRHTTLEIDLTPANGDRFQPTGFPDLGPALYQRPVKDDEWVTALLVESPQSMANHAEGQTWQPGTDDQRAELTGVPYVRIVSPSGEFLSASRLEAHRLSSAYVMKGKFDGVEGVSLLADRLGLQKGKPLDMRAVARAIFSLDPLSLIHGVFFAQKTWPWQPKVARALTMFIEAYDVRPVFSGGVKTDRIQLSGGAAEGSTKKASEEGFGMVPFPRTEYTARSIVAHVNIDHQQIHSYGLGVEAEELLVAIVEFELANLFREGLRLRTACDLVVTGVRGGELAEVDAAAARLGAAISAAADQLGSITTAVFSGR